MSRRTRNIRGWLGSSDGEPLDRPAVGLRRGPGPSNDGAGVPPGEGQPAAEQGAGDWELFLLRLRYREGRLIHLGGNRPILLDDPDEAWIVYSGHVEVFAVRIEDGQAVGARSHLFRATAGTALFGLDLTERPVGLLASAPAGTQLVRVKRASLGRLAGSAEFGGLVAVLLDRWIDGLSSALIRDLPPRQAERLQVGRELTLAGQGVARTPRQVLWVTLRHGRSRLAGRQDLPVSSGAHALPLSSHAWLQATEETRLEAIDTRQALARSELWSDLAGFHVLVADGLAADATERQRSEWSRLEERAGADRTRLEAAHRRLASILRPSAVRVWDELDEADPLLAACTLVGRALGIRIAARRRAGQATDREEPIQAIARAARVRVRRVALRDDWWRGENGPLVAFVARDGRPVALLPSSSHGYELHDALAKQKAVVSEQVAATLSPFAYSFYRSFDDRALSAGDLLPFGLRGCGRDLVTVALAGVGAGLLGLLTPMATQVIVDQAIPGGHRSLLLQLGMALLVAAVAMGLVQVMREIAVLRLAGRLDAVLQAAVMDRLLELPTAFFRRYTAGDLGTRVLAIGAIRETLSRVALSAMLTSLFSLFSFGLLFYYAPWLALLACGLLLFFIIVAAGAVVSLVRNQRGIEAQAGRLSSIVLQLINGVAKLRVSSAEARAFSFWAHRFADFRQSSFRAGLVVSGLTTLSAVYPILVSVAVFGAVVLVVEPRPSIGAFLAFTTALAQFTMGALSLVSVFTSVIQIIPSYERVRPILQTVPEVDNRKAQPGELSGAIDVGHVSFRYQATGPLILNDVSIQIRPGELVALVGPSGSGKSTLLRLLLRFETPESGAILYDGVDLDTLDVRNVRRQIGTVLQSGRLMSGDILENIVGSTGLTMDDAWQAAAMAGLDEDIRQMPMGMHTVIGEGGSTLSGGQRQRLLIARAIVTRPRLLFFDESTSALDNRTQEIVSRSVESLAATRVVIAHRLSTVINADRIYVFEAGRVVESGNYRQLMQRRGLFARLARRQIV